MSEQAKQEWRIEANRTGWKSRIFLNDEDVGRCISRASLEVPADGTTRLTLTLVVDRIEVVTDPELYLIIGTRRFRVIEETLQGDRDDGLFRERHGDAE